MIERYRRHPQKFTSVLLIVEVHNKYHRHHRHHCFVRHLVIIPPNERVIPMADVNVVVGHTVSIKIGFLDQNGNPMLTPVVPDAVPAWTDTTPATGTLTESADGLSASEVAVAAGSDVVNVALAVGGVAFAASQGIVVSAAPQVLTSIGLTATVN